MEGPHTGGGRVHFWTQGPHPEVGGFRPGTHILQPARGRQPSRRPGPSRLPLRAAPARPCPAAISPPLARCLCPPPSPVRLPQPVRARAHARPSPPDYRALTRSRPHRAPFEQRRTTVVREYVQGPNSYVRPTGLERLTCPFSPPSPHFLVHEQMYTFACGQYDRQVHTR